MSHHPKPKKARYCGMCDRLVQKAECELCGADTDSLTPDEVAELEGLGVRRKLTRAERLQGLADRGIDTWEDYRGER